MGIFKRLKTTALAATVAQRSLSPCLPALAGALLLVGCSPTRISVRHDPIYRPAAHTSTIYVTATSQTGIKRISVNVVTGDLVACRLPNGLSSMFPCRQNASQVTYSCTFKGGAQSATCPVARQLTGLTLVTYSATAVPTFGKAVSTNHITYSGGAPSPGTIYRPSYLPGEPSPSPPHSTDTQPSGEPLPPPPQPSPGDVLRPIWLESDIPPTNLPKIYWDAARRIDLGFLPDTDWGANEAGYAQAVADIVQYAFLPPVRPNKEDYIRWRQLFSIWAGPSGADAEYCRATFGNWTQVAQAYLDGEAIIHLLAFGGSDCAIPPWGTVLANSADYPSIFIHESGHLLWCMGDEHPNAEALACSDPANNFASQENCEQAATTNGFNPAWCKRIGTTGLWRITDGSSEIMAEDGWPTGLRSNDWRDTNNVVILKQMAACLKGSCL